MGQNASCSCRVSNVQGLFIAVREGDVQMAEALLDREPALIAETTFYDKLSLLHIAAANGQTNMVSLCLDRRLHPDVLNRRKQTPLMLAAMHGKASCIERLLQAGANVLLFDSLNGRTCLHYAANQGNTECLQIILAAAHATGVAESWGFGRFVNVRDGRGATPLHLAARMSHPDIVQMLVDSGALVCASTGAHGYEMEQTLCLTLLGLSFDEAHALPLQKIRPGSTPLHLAARGGCLDCIRKLLAWGADRIQRDSLGRTPYAVALKYKNAACAALLNPNTAEPLVWPYAWKFISNLEREAKLLLENALIKANRAREKSILDGAASSLSSFADEDDNIEDNVSDVSETEVCCICFDRPCTIEVRDCGHQMCARCTLALCCHNKPNPTIACSPPPVCPFCRSSIAQLVVAPVKGRDKEQDSSQDNKPRISKSPVEGSSSFKGISPKGSFGKMTGKSFGKIADNSDWVEKP